MTAGWVFLGVAALAATAGYLGFCYVVPKKRCRTCKGQGLCIRCGLTGRKLRAGAWLVHRELRKRN